MLHSGFGCPGVLRFSPCLPLLTLGINCSTLSPRPSCLSFDSPSLALSQLTRQGLRQGGPAAASASCVQTFSAPSRGPTPLLLPPRLRPPCQRCRTLHLRRLLLRLLLTLLQWVLSATRAGLRFMELSVKRLFAYNLSTTALSIKHVHVQDLYGAHLLKNRLLPNLVT